MLAAACTDSPVAPELTPQPGHIAALECRVDVHAESVACAAPEPALPAVSAARMIGGQGRYVALANDNNSFNGTTRIFETYVTVQSLVAPALGTSDGVTPTGVRIFFYSGPTTPVTVANADSVGFFTSSDQPYFLYNEVLTTYEVSSPKPWRFNVPSGVTTFSFMVYVSADVANGTGPLLDAVWKGQASNDWSTAANWEGSAVPGASSAVQIPAASLIPGAQMPVLGGDVSVASLLVGNGSSLSLGTYKLTVSGNVDATGGVGTGTLVMTGSGALLKGVLPSVNITGSARLQGAVTTSGAVSVTGTLTVADSALSIAIP